MRLRHRIAIIVLIAIVPTIVVFGWFALQERSAAESRLQDDQARRADLRALTVSQMLVDVRSELQALSAFEQPVGGPLPRLGDELFRLSRLDPSFRFVGLADPSGHVIVSSTRGADGNVSDRPWFRRAIAARRPSSDGYEVGVLSGGPSLVVAVPVLDSVGRVAGVIFSEVPLQVIGDLLAQIAPPAGTVLIVIDHRGRVLARNPAPSGSRPGSREATALVGAIVGAEDGSVDGSASDGIVRRWDYRKLVVDPASPLHVLVGYDSQVVFAADHRAFAIGVGALLLVTVAAVLTASLTATRWVLNPMSVLNEGTSTGRLDASALRSLTAVREFGELGSRIGEMAANLEAESLIAERLQEAMLALPQGLMGVEFAHAYHSATDSAKVGGDFYDLFPIKGQMLGITIGDVAGKGLDAAVLTSLVRNTIRAHATEKGAVPAQILNVTNDVVFASTSPEAFATVFFGVLDTEGGRFVWANAGHTTGVLITPSADLTALSPTGMILGAFEHVEFTQAERRFNVGELLFLYTDGLTEAKRDHDLFGEGRTFRLLRRLHAAPPDEVVQVVANEVLHYSGHRLSDDMALMALRRLPSPTEPAKSRLVIV